MKAIKIVNQEQLEQKAIDSMIAYEHGSISKQRNAPGNHPCTATLRQHRRTPENRSERVDYKNDPRPEQPPVGPSRPNHSQRLK